MAPDDVAGIDLDDPGAAQVVVVRERVTGGQDAARSLAFKASSAFSWRRKKKHR